MANGGRVEVDAFALATGFNAQEFLPDLLVVGAEGQELHAVWREAGGAEAYLGTMMPGFPNFFMMYGPNTNLGHNSIVFMLECQAHFISRALRRLYRFNGRTVSVAPQEMAAYQKWMEAGLRRTAWAGNCASWYKNAAGKITSNWSTHTLGYWLRSRLWSRRLIVQPYQHDRS